MKLLVFILLISTGCTHTIKVDSSFVEGCSYGAYSAISSLGKEPAIHLVQAHCMDMYLKRLELVNPKYELEHIEDEAI